MRIIKADAAAVASRINELPEHDRQLIHTWLSALVVIRNSTVSRREKIAAAIEVTRPVAGLLSKLGFERIKPKIWDERSWMTRIGLGAAVVTAASIGSEGAGIAALGGAIGVPLWILFGSGGALVGAVLDKIKVGSSDPQTKPEPTQIVRPLS